jgi:hypothetical protein
MGALLQDGLADGTVGPDITLTLTLTLTLLELELGRVMEIIVEGD